MRSFDLTHIPPTHWLTSHSLPPATNNATKNFHTRRRTRRHIRRFTATADNSMFLSLCGLFSHILTIKHDHSQTGLPPLRHASHNSTPNRIVRYNSTVEWRGSRGRSGWYVRKSTLPFPSYFLLKRFPTNRPPNPPSPPPKPLPLLPFSRHAADVLQHPFHRY